MPRSGTTWLSQIFASSPDVRLKFCPLFSYEFKNALDENATPGEWRKFLEDVYHAESEFLDQEHLRKRGLIPLFEKKNATPGHLVVKSVRFHHMTPHMLEKCSTIRVIHIVRHPCAALYSWISDPDEFPADADYMQEWRSGACRKNGVGEFWGFEDWKRVTGNAVALSRKYPDRHKIIRYEELTDNASECAEELFDFAGLVYGKETQDFVFLSQNTHDTHKHSVFKKPQLKDKWQDRLDPEIIAACMEEIKGTELEKFAK